VGRGRPLGDGSAGEAGPAATEWVYDLRGLDLAAWVERAGGELAALTGPDDTVVTLVGDAPAADVAVLRQALARAGYPSRHEPVDGIPALVYDRQPAGPPAATEEEA